MRIITRKLLLVTLLSPSVLQAMQSYQTLIPATGSAHVFQPQSLKDYCLLTIKKRVVAEQLPKHCALLNKKIAIQFPKENIDPQLSKEMALKTLIEIAQISVENNIMRITPTSITLKNITDDVFNENKEYYFDDLINTILPLLKVHSDVIQICTQKIAQGFLYNKEKRHYFLNNAPPALYVFLHREIDALAAYVKQQDEIAFSWVP